MSRLSAFPRDSRTREFLLWLLPALVVGLILRVVLTAHLPYGIYHDDTPDFLTTPEKLLYAHRFELHQKKTFLVPILYSVPFFIGVPALIAIPIFQHFLGLGVVGMVGLLVRLWFRAWRLAILPLTILVAINPVLLWYEHTLMAELVFIFTSVLLAVAGTLYTLEQSRGRFFFLVAALILESGARPEGKLLFGFAALLVTLLHFRGWRSAWPRLAILVVLAVAITPLTKTSQAGLLLYTSVARLTPAELRCAPGFEPYIAPIRDDLQARWDEKPSFPKVRDRRAVAEVVERYLNERTWPPGERVNRSVNDFCKKLAVETCAKNFGYLPIHIYHKFRAVSTEPPSGRLDNDWLFREQRKAFTGAPRALALSRGLTGQDLHSIEELNAFIDTHYGEVAWFDRLQNAWMATVNYFHFPNLRVPNPEFPIVPLYHPGVPFYFLVAALGIIAVALRRDRLQFFHIAWGLTLFGFFYTIMLTANVRPRFRIVFEPFWFIYIALLFDCTWLALSAPFRRKS